MRKKYRKKIMQKMLIFLCIAGMCFSDAAVVEGFFEGNRVLAASETEQESETETPQEIEQESETETPQETEQESETETPQETEQESETETPQETEQESETETPKATEPDEPVLKSAVSSSYNSVTVKWKAVSGADGYRVYRKVSGKSWERVAQVDGESVSWKDTGLTCGTTYTYTVRAYAEADGKYLFSTYDKKGVSARPIPSAPKLTGTTSNASSVTVKWDKSAGATSYLIYRKTSDTEWKKVASVKKSVTSYEDKGVKKGTKYIYTVKVKHDSVAGSYDKKGIQGAALVPAVTLKSVCISSKGNGKVQWVKQSGADGYFIYRKEEGKSWSRVGTVSAGKTSFSEKGLKNGKKYYYTVTGYMTLNGKKIKGRYVKAGIAPKLEYSGKFVRDVTKTYLGTSGEGRKMYSYTIGTGKNHIVMTMAIHGWEDEWARDGALLVKTGEKLIRYAADHLSVLNARKYSIIIVPMANPDGLYSGKTSNGPGRCTTYRYNSSGKLVKGGVDLNRCFPAGFSAQYSSRSYTGAKPLMAKEAVILKKYIDSSKGSGKNIFIDSHGWYNQTITRYKGQGAVYKAFKKYFSGTRPASFGKGLGYISGYAYSKGYEAVLFEFPYVSSSSQFDKKGYADKFINSVFYMVKNVK